MPCPVPFWTLSVSDWVICDGLWVLRELCQSILPMA